jgi:hypothetical protein
LVHQGQQVKMAFDQHGPRALIATVFGGPFPNLGALAFGNGIEAILSRFAAGQDVNGMPFATSAMTVGFSALAPKQIKGALHHRFGALEAAQGVGQCRIGTPELLAEFGGIGAQTASLIYIPIQIGKRKVAKKGKTRLPGVPPSNPRPFTRF